MGLTVSAQAASYYSMTLLQSSRKDQENTVDSSELSQKLYGVRSVADAVDASNYAATHLTGVSNASAYAKNAIRNSQTEGYRAGRDAVDNSRVSDLLGNRAGLSGLYGLLGSTSNLKSAIQILAQSYGGDTAQGYLGTMKSDYTAGTLFNRMG